jgi:hypothetical protein
VAPIPDRAALFCAPLGRQFEAGARDAEAAMTASKKSSKSVKNLKTRGAKSERSGKVKGGMMSVAARSVLGDNRRPIP